MPYLRLNQAVKMNDTQHAWMRRLARHPLMVDVKERLDSWIDEPDLLRHVLRENQFGQALLCVLLGMVVGAIVASLHHALKVLHEAIFLLGPGEYISSASSIDWVRVVTVPAAGAVLLVIVSSLMRYWRPKEVIDPIEANALMGGRMPFIDNLRLLLESFISSASGVSFGMEAAYTQMGSGFLSWAGQKLQLRREDLRIFVAAGAAAAVSAAFNAPLAGAFYGFELVLSVYTISALLQVGLCALSSAVFVRIFTEGTPIFQLSNNVIDVPIYNYGLFFVLGIASAFVGIATMKMVTSCEHTANRLSLPDWLRPVCGGMVLSLIALLFPQVLGSGQGAIDDHLNRAWPLLPLIVLLLAKMAASAVSIGAGFRGGLFSSSLFLGCLTGQIMGVVASYLLPQTPGQVESFMLVGMGAVATSIIGAPVTMVLLVLELTGSFAATSGVLFGVLVSSSLTRYMFGYSFSTWRFHLRGLRIHGAQDIGWISDLKVSKLMKSDARIVPGDTSLADLREVAPLGDTRRVFVVDKGHEYQGVVDVNAIHSPNLDKRLNETVARELAKGKDFYLLPDEDIQHAMKQFERSELEELPVLDSLKSHKIIGYVTEAYTLKRYAQELETQNSAIRLPLQGKKLS